MAFFGVTLETIERVWPHPDADKLDLAQCKGMSFQFVIGKGAVRPNDVVLYFPIDSVLTPELKVKIGLEKMPGHRIKTIRLRGEISQGFVFLLSRAVSELGLSSNMTPEQMTELLGVTKYDPPVEITTFGKLEELPEGISKYDIEGCERYQNILDILHSAPVHITEKLEGTNCSVSKIQGKMYVNQRNNTIIPIEGKDNPNRHLGPRQKI